MNTTLNQLNDLLQDAIAAGDDKRVREINMAMLRLLSDMPDTDTPDGDMPDGDTGNDDTDTGDDSDSDTDTGDDTGDDSDTDSDDDTGDDDDTDSDDDTGDDDDTDSDDDTDTGNPIASDSDDDDDDDDDDDFDTQVQQTVKDINDMLPAEEMSWKEQEEIQIDQEVQHEARPLVKYFRDRLQFENADAASFDDGHRSGRLLSRNAVAVATGDDTPFSKRNDPSAPARVFVQVLVDASPSMLEIDSKHTRMRKAAQVAVALDTVCRDHPGIEFEIVKYASKSAICDRSDSAIAMSNQEYELGTSTFFREAFKVALTSDRRKLAVANHDAIVQVLITDGELENENVTEFTEQCVTRDVASSEERCCVLIDPMPYTVREFREAYGDPSRICQVKQDQIHDCAPFIASAIQRTISRAEARRG